MFTVEYLASVWPHIVTGLSLGLDIAVSSHAILYKRDARAAVAWVGFIWFVPIGGALLYLLLGINRIERRARELRRRRPRWTGGATEANHTEQLDADSLAAVRDAPITALVRLVGDVTHNPLLPGNRVTPLTTETAWSALRAAVDGAQRSLSLTTYIFDNDPAGRELVDALARAVRRGVQVRVIIDAVGAGYSWPSIIRRLRHAGIPVASFLPRFLLRGFRYANLRNHRKILVVDGRIAFTGGMNIRVGHFAEFRDEQPILDLHFRLEGPVVAQLQEVFADDWAFCSGEMLEGEVWFPRLESVGATLARGIPDGPDEDFDKARLTILGALACAQSSVRIVTPYFVPDPTVITAFNIATLRGIEIDVVLPQKSNLRLVQWASTALLWQVLEHGCRVWLTPPPFDHSKLMVVDGVWSLIGSTNWDPRSMRLNFEFNVECYDRDLAAALEAITREKISKARSVTLADVDGRSLPTRFRDGVARLFSPFL